MLALLPTLASLTHRLKDELANLQTLLFSSKGQSHFLHFEEKSRKKKGWIIIVCLSVILLGKGCSTESS